MYTKVGMKNEKRETQNINKNRAHVGFRNCCLKNSLSLLIYEVAGKPLKKKKNPKNRTKQKNNKKQQQQTHKRKYSESHEKELSHALSPGLRGGITKLLSGVCAVAGEWERGMWQQCPSTIDQIPPTPSTEFQ